MRGHEQLSITRDGNTSMAILSDNMTWSCDDDCLQQYLSQLLMLYSRPITREMMKAVKRDLEYDGYTVDLSQSHASVVFEIIQANDDIRAFWSNAHGWAPTNAAELLARSRLDWQVSLSYCLKSWLEPSTAEDRDGRLILAWVNLGCLVEGSLKFFLSVYEADYSKAPRTRGRKREPCNIDDLRFEEMKQYLNKHIWTDSQRHWDDWLGKIQLRRNAVHAYEGP